MVQQKSMPKRQIGIKEGVLITWDGIRAVLQKALCGICSLKDK